MKLALALATAAAILAVALLARGDEDRAAAGRAAFGTVHEVLLHPRCMNCHPSGDRPLQGDDSHPHAQNISRRSAANGLPCSTCHRDSNGDAAGSPPGAPHWRLPPAETPMVFQGRTPRALCEQLKDPAQTHGKDLAALLDHVAADPLVLWGWSPGPGRTPVPTPHATFVAAFRTWVDAGAPCP